MFRAAPAADTMGLARLIRGTGLVFAGNAASAVLGFACFVLLARMLSPGEFGAVALFLTILDLSQIFMDMVIGGSTLVSAGRYLKSDPTRAAMAFKIATAVRLGAAAAVALAGWLCAAWLSALLFPDVSRIRELRLAFLGVLGIAIYTSCISALQARQEFGRLSLTLLYKNVFRLSGVAMLIALGALSVDSAVDAIIMATFAAALLSLLTTDIRFLWLRGFDRVLLRDLMVNNKWLLLLLLVLVFGSRIDFFMLASLAEPYELGRYAAAFQLSSVVAILSQSLVTTLFPEIATYTERGQLRRFVVRYLTFLPVCFAPIAIVVLLGPWIVDIAFGSEYATAIPVFRILVVVACITLLSNPVLMAMFPLGQVRELALVNLGQTAARIGLNVAFIPEFGAAGAALVDLVTKLGLVLVAGTRLWRQLQPCNGPVDATQPRA